jgi:hypothetical protein
VSLFIGAWLVISMASPALAYLDPMTGSFLIQGAIASAVAVLAAIRKVRERVLALVGFRKAAAPVADADRHDVAATKTATQDAVR